jgi:hypothetical protein
MRVVHKWKAKCSECIEFEIPFLIMIGIVDKPISFTWVCIFFPEASNKTDGFYVCGSVHRKSILL